MATKYAVRGVVGDVAIIDSSAHAAYAALGYVDLGPPWIELADDLGAWDTGPLYLILHADGRRYAVTSLNFSNYYQPLGFVVVGPELPGFLVPATRATQAGDTRVTAAGDTRVTDG